MALSGRAMLALLVILGIHSASAANYTVGGAGGWTVQTSSNNVYDAQFKTINLVVGDNLLFPFTAPNHNVYEIPSSDLASCSFANPIQKFTNSNAVVPLTSAGVHAFACEVPTHCSNFGMSLSVTVQAAAPGAAPSSPPAAAPVAPPTASPTHAPTSPPATTPVAPSSPAAPTSPGSASDAPGQSPTNAGSASIISFGPAMVVAAIVAGFGFLLV